MQLVRDPLLDAVTALASARDEAGVCNIVRRAARELTAADGVTFVLRKGNHCYYADEDAIGPLWKGRQFPIETCISGWAMLNRQHVVIPDIYSDDRIPHDAYRPTFVKSLMMVPVRREEPIAAIGAYWATYHVATPMKWCQAPFPRKRCLAPFPFQTIVSATSSVEKLDSRHAMRSVPEDRRNSWPGMVIFSAPARATARSRWMLGPSRGWSTCTPSSTMPMTTAPLVGRRSRHE